MPLPPTASPAHISYVAASLLDRPASRHTSALRPGHGPARTAPHLLPTTLARAHCVTRGEDYSLGSRTGPSSMLSRLPLLLAGACRRSSSRVSHPLSDAVRSDAALLDAVAGCDAPPPLPGHSTCPRPAVARARPPSPIGLLSDTLQADAPWIISLLYSVAVLHFVCKACDWLVASALGVRASFRVVVCPRAVLLFHNHQSIACGKQSKVTTLVTSSLYMHYTRVMRV